MPSLLLTLSLAHGADLFVCAAPGSWSATPVPVDAPQATKGCGCSAAPSTTTAWYLLLLTVAARRSLR